MSHGSALTRLVLPLLALVCVAQQPPGSEQPGPVATFQSATRVVVLDVVVTNKQGKPVPNLSKADFTILEDGKPQTIASFEGPNEHVPVSADGARENTAWLPEVALSKSGAEALTILVFDALDTRILDQAYARSEIKKFLAAHGPRLQEPTALMALEEKRLELLHDYTRDASAIEKSLEGHRAHLPFRLLGGMGFNSAYASTDTVEAAERFSDAILALREIAAANTQFAGRKNLIWIGPGFPSLDHVKGPPNAKSRLHMWGRETMDLIAQARLVIYTIDPRGLQASPDESITPTKDALAFESIAPLTGGHIFNQTNDLDARIASSIEDGSAYYAISYYPSNRRWDGEFRRVHVLLRDTNYIARTRAGYFALNDGTLTSGQLDALLSAAVLNPLPYHALSITANATLSQSPGRTALVTVDIDPAGLHWQEIEPQKHHCEVTVVSAGFSAKGKVVAHSVKELEVVVDDAKYAALVKDGMVMKLAMQLPPDAVRMRVVARDSTNGNLGTADLTPEGQQFH